MFNQSKRSIILTGATGFLGAFLMSGLLEQGYHVTVLGRASKEMTLAERVSSLARWFDIEPAENLSVIVVDFSKKHLGLDDITYSRLCDHTCKIIHCASDTSFAERNRDRVVETNVDSLQSLLEFAADSRPEHFCYVSTAYASGMCEGICFERPVTSLSFNNVYEESKALAEKLIARSCEISKVPFSILRPSIVYGHSKTGKALKFNALYYVIKSVSCIRDIYVRDIEEQGGERSRKWGYRLDDTGTLHLPLRIHLSGKGTVNLIPIDYFVETALRIIEHPEASGIYHITSSSPPDMTTLIEYTQRFLGIQGVRACWGLSGNGGDSNPAEELFDKFIEQYRPYLSDTRSFDQRRTKSVTQGLTAPLLTYDIFEKCMSYAVGHDWGKIKLDK